jgi:hypothetical protein
MSAGAAIIRRRDPAVIAARAHAVLDATARRHAEWPRAGRRAMNEAFLTLHTALEEYGTAADEGADGVLAAETACWAMALLLLSVSVFLGKAAADEMAENAAEVAW